MDYKIWLRSVLACISCDESALQKRIESREEACLQLLIFETTNAPIDMIDIDLGWFVSPG